MVFPAKSYTATGAVLSVSLFLSSIAFSNANAEQVDARAAGFSNTAQLATFGLYNNAIITDQLNLKRINDNYVFLSSNPDDPFESASGSCFGGAVVRNMQVQGGGVCSLKDKNGSPFAISYEITQIQAGTYSGNWAILGGSEKWATAKGSGTWSRVTLPNMAMSVTHLEGEVTF